MVGLFCGHLRAPCGSSSVNSVVNNDPASAREHREEPLKVIPLRFPLWSGVACAASVLLAGILWHINSTYCAFGFGGFQCNHPFSGRGDQLAMATAAVWLIMPVSFIVWNWRLVRWRRQT